MNVAILTSGNSRLLPGLHNILTETERVLNMHKIFTLSRIFNKRSKTGLFYYLDQNINAQDSVIKEVKRGCSIIM